jgi:hypothetical protein
LVVHLHPALVDPDGLAADLAHVVEGMRAEEQGLAPALVVEDLVDALALEVHVAHGEDLVQDQDIGVGGHRHAETQAADHARGVGAQGRVDEVSELAELHDLVDAVLGLPS